MCGIAGVLRFDQKPVSLVTLKRMTNSLRHRGPDGEGVYIDDVLGLGHRRLSIVDLSSAGHQPMQSECGRYVLTYNGEVYNFQNLRTELEARGYRFRSNTDTEVVLNAFCEWGQACLLKLNGMFAFAIWDKKRKELLLARDRYGIKPVYYFKSSKAFLFGSEVKSIIASGNYNPEVDLGALSEYLTFQNFISSDTLFRGVKILEAGTVLKINRSARYLQHHYWDFQFTDEIDSHENEILDRSDYLLQQSIKRQLVADVPINSYLSGGVDSGTITLLAAKQHSHIKTFTIGFNLSLSSAIEQLFDERKKAEYLSSIAKTEHYEMVIKAGDMERCLSKLVWHLEEPRVGQSYPNYYAAKLASKFSKVVLSGIGGDELFAGYPWRYSVAYNSSYEDYLTNYFYYWQRLLSNQEFNQLIFPYQKDRIASDNFYKFKSLFSAHLRSKSDNFVNQSLYFEAKTFLHGLLVVEDKLSMAHGLETRLPLLDNDLVDYVARIPVSMNLKKTKNFYVNSENYNHTVDKLGRQSVVGKYILRKLLMRYAPSSVAKLKKQGFSAPDASWFRGESLDYVKSVVENKNNPLYNYLDFATMQPLIRGHFSGLKNRRFLIWSVLYLSEFLRQFISKGVSIELVSQPSEF